MEVILGRAPSVGVRSCFRAGAVAVAIHGTRSQRRDGLDVVGMGVVLPRLLRNERALLTPLNLHLLKECAVGGIFLAFHRKIMKDRE